MLFMNVYAAKGKGTGKSNDGSRPVVNPGATRDPNKRAPRGGLARDAQASRRKPTALRNGRTGRA